MFYTRFIHEQDSAGSSSLDLPCSFDTSCSNPRYTSSRFKADQNAISGRTTCYSRVRFDVQFELFDVCRPSSEFSLFGTVFGMMLVRIGVDAYTAKKRLEFTGVDGALGEKIARDFVDESV